MSVAALFVGRGAVGREFAPAGDLLFFAPPKKSRQKKGGPTGRGPAGSLRCSCAGRRCRTHFALTALRSNSGSESEHEARMLRCAPAPRPALLGTARRGLKMDRAIAALGLGLFLLPLHLGEGGGEGEPRRRRNKPPIGHQRLPVKREQLSKPESHAAVSRTRCRAICACTCAGAVPPSVPRALRLPRRLSGSNTSFSMAG